MKRYCSRALLIEDGNISFTGSVKKTAVHYENLFNTNKEVVTVNNKLEDKPANRWGSGEAVFEEVKLINEKDAKEIRFSLNVKSNNNINKNIICAFTVKSGDGKNLFGDSVDLGIIQKGTNSFFMSFDNILARGKYHLDLSLRIDGEKEYLDFWIDAFTFRCGGPKNDLSILARVKLRR